MDKIEKGVNYATLLPTWCLNLDGKILKESLEQFKKKHANCATNSLGWVERFSGTTTTYLVSDKDVSTLQIKNDWIKIGLGGEISI